MSPLLERTPRPPPRPALLVIDDDLGVRESYAIIFGDAMDVVEATSANDALTAAHRRDFTAILLDVLMPRVSGLEAFEPLRAAQPRTPIIVVSAIDNTETAVSAMRLGAFDYVTKPFDVERIVAIVGRAVISTAGVVRVVGRDTGLAAAVAVLASARARIPATISAAGPIARTVHVDARSVAEIYGYIAPGSVGISGVVARVATYVAAHYARVNVEHLAQALDFSPNYLSHVFRDDTTMTAKDYVTRVRVEVARYLLKETHETLEFIAERVGLYDASHLTRVFRDQTGVTPGVYRG